MGGRLRGYRLRARLTLGGLAARSGVSKGTLSRWESGVSRPRLVELGAVLDALGVGAGERQRTLAELRSPEANRLLRLEDAPPPVTGDLLRTLRLRRGLNQADAARLVGVTQSTLARWERGQSEPDAPTRHRLAFSLGALPEEAAALVAGRFEGGDEGGTPEEHLDRLVVDQMLFRHHPLRDLRFLSSGERAWRRFQATGEEGYAQAYACVRIARAVVYAEDGALARAEAELRAYRASVGLIRGAPPAGAQAAYADSRVLRARGRRGAAHARLADEHAKTDDVQAWFASERAEIVEAVDPKRGLRLHRQAFERARAAWAVNPLRNVDVFYRGHQLGSALARHGRIGEALDVFEESGAVYGGLAAMLQGERSYAGYSVQHLLRLIEAHLEAGERDAVEAHLETARTKIAGSAALQGFGRACDRLETRIQREALRVRA